MANSFKWNSFSYETNLTCHMDHTVLLAAWQMKRIIPALIPAIQASTRFTYPWWMEVWVDLGVGFLSRWFTCPQKFTHISSNQLIVTHPGFGPTTWWLHVQHLNHYTTESSEVEITKYPIQHSIVCGCRLGSPFAIHVSRDVSNSELRAALIDCMMDMFKDSAFSQVGFSRTLCRALTSFLRVAASTSIAHLSHRNSVCLSLCPSVHHTGGSVKNGAS